MADGGEVELVSDGRVRADGRSRRARAVLAAIAVLAVLVTTMGLSSRQDQNDVRSGESAHTGPTPTAESWSTSDPVSSSTTSSPTTSTSATLAGAGASSDDDPTGNGGSDDEPVPGQAPPGTSPPPPPEATTTTVCADSYEPGCGAFRWTGSTPVNQPMVIEVESLTGTPVVGEDFRIRIAASDPDAFTFRAALHVTKVSDGDSYPSILSCSWNGAPEAFGPWVPPVPRAGTFEQHRSKSEDEPGTYWVSVCVTSTAWALTPGGGLARCPGDGTTAVFEGWRCRDPFADFATARIQIEVAPAP